MIDKKKAIISLAIAIIFTLFVGYGIEVFDPGPEREDFCREDLYEIKEEGACTSAGGVWNDEKIGRPVAEPVVGLGFCGPGKECYDSFDLARTRHDKIVFIVGIIVGLLAVLTGMLLKRDSISTGILSGGVLVILYGTIRYWSHANNTLKFILLGITLAVLLWIAYKKLDKK